jgi:hypothetical protein
MSARTLVTLGSGGLRYFLTADRHIIALQVNPSSLTDGLRVPCSLGYPVAGPASAIKGLWDE